MSKLVNLGSLCIDNVFQVPNIASAGETVTSRGHEIHPGGKGLNQSLAASRAEANVVHVGCVGADGGMLVDVLSDSGVDVSNIQVLDMTSGSAYIQVDEQGQNSIFITGGANRSVTTDQVKTTLDLIDAEDWLLLQNEINDLDTVLSLAYERNVNVAFNVAPVDGREQHYPYDELSLLFVNEIEAMALAGESSYNAAFDRLREDYPDLEVVLTLGRNGLLYGKGQQTMSVPSYQVDSVDETAAGDAFIGFYMAAVLRSEDTEVALHEASAAGALAVTRSGAATSIPNRSDVVEFLSQYDA